MINKLLNLKNGDSIQAIQTKLFVKKCLADEYLVKTNKIPKQQWRNSFIVDQVFGSTIAQTELSFKSLKAKFNF
jgi:hypothetical protein